MFLPITMGYSLMLLVLTVSVSVIPVSGQKVVSVSGIVVDEKGKPLANAIVSFPPGICNGCHDQTFGSNLSLEDGVFFLDDRVKGDAVRLFIEGPIPKGLWNPVSPADLRLERFPEFRGTILKVPESGATIQLGEVLPHVIYRPVSVNLTKLFNEDRDYLQNGSSVTVHVEYKGERISSNTLTDRRDFGGTKDTTTFALPIGEWRVIIIACSGGKCREESLMVNVRGFGSEEPSF